MIFIDIVFCQTCLDRNYKSLYNILFNKPI